MDRPPEVGKVINFGYWKDPIRVLKILQFDGDGDLCSIQGRNIKTGEISIIIIDHYKYFKPMSNKELNEGI